MKFISVLTTLVAVASAAPAAHWEDWKPKGCTPYNTAIRKDFDKLPPYERKEYTDAIKCLMTQPSQLDPIKYPGAINRFFDYSAIHINRTSVVHLDGFFLTWHRMYLHLFEQDLKNLCGFKGTLPYWNWPATADNLKGSNVFNGDAYSMSGDGAYIDSGPIILGPTFSLPKGSGGGCVTDGPFANMKTTMAVIPIQGLITGAPLPPTAFARNDTCLTRDLNVPVAQRYCNQTAFDQAIAAPNQAVFSTLLNGIFGGGELGLHSGAHFLVGAPASSIYVSPQDPIWFPMHTFLDLIYVQWQKAHPDIADQLYGTLTANNAPPSANATLDSVEPDWGYLYPGVPIKELISTTAGPFCYDYEY